MWNTMKSWQMQWPSKATFGPFLQLNSSNFRLNSVTCIRVKKIVEKSTFEGVLGELGSKKYFCTQSFRKNLRLILGFMKNSALREKFNFYFPKVF